MLGAQLGQHLPLADGLDAHGHHVEVVHDGEAAVRAAQRHVPDIALLDIGMPRLDGYQVARELRADVRTQGVHLVAISGWGQDADRQAATEAGFDHHLVKPLDYAAVDALLAAGADLNAPLGPDPRPALFAALEAPNRSPEVIERLIRAGADPLAFREGLLQQHPRHLAVLDRAAQKAGWGTPLPKGRARGVAVHESFNTFVAQVVEVTVAPDGSFRVDRVVCAVDCGIAPMSAASLLGAAGMAGTAVTEAGVGRRGRRVTSSREWTMASQRATIPPTTRDGGWSMTTIPRTRPRRRRIRTT